MKPMRFERDKVLKVLRDINDRIMAQYGSPAKDEAAYPTIKKIFTEAAPSVPGIQAVLDSGMLDKVTAVTDEEKAKAIDEALTHEIQDAIRRGELPHPDRDPIIKQWKHRNQKKK